MNLNILKRLFKVTLIILVSFNSVYLAHDCFAASDEDLSNQLDEIIMMRDPRNLGNLIRPLGPDVSRMLIAKYHIDQNVFQKIRMLNMLAYYPDPETVEFLKVEAKNAPNAHLQEAALQSISISQGQHQEEFIAGFLDDSNLAIRLGAAISLARIQTLSSKIRLNQFMSLDINSSIASQVKHWQDLNRKSEGPTVRHLVRIPR